MGGVVEGVKSEVRQKTVVRGKREGVLVVIGMRVCFDLRELQPSDQMQILILGNTTIRPEMIIKLKIEFPFQEINTTSMTNSLAITI
ncbi:hypothetical protein LB504_007863 [Fusarium proliferatum]|nr:hypothetical protein LB504_007863 [Fusarium proliferatum]